MSSNFAKALGIKPYRSVISQTLVEPALPIYDSANRVVAFITIDAAYKSFLLPIYQNGALIGFKKA